ncbi:hypothetical protein HK097_004268 [Rhizophlyctis rosea]|uniref:Uncharacterized protein n=1 Tax=Rhizophlyctis rosea TaxID=64517 RepID=A0AAD5S1R3_9FUNG|nr:hypothetical protein HK097_004268 [Rhizophlyctis rosea]
MDGWVDNVKRERMRKREEKGGNSLQEPFVFFPEGHPALTTLPARYEKTIGRMVHPNPAVRPTVKEVVEEEWVREIVTCDPEGGSSSVKHNHTLEQLSAQGGPPKTLRKPTVRGGPAGGAKAGGAALVKLFEPVAEGGEGDSTAESISSLDHTHIHTTQLPHSPELTSPAPPTAPSTNPTSDTAVPLDEEGYLIPIDEPLSIHIRTGSTDAESTEPYYCPS